MDSFNNGVGKNWSEYSDEELAWLAQHGDVQRAWAEVRRRTLHWVEPLVAHLVHGLPLRQGDLPDAQQVAGLAIREALLRFDLDQLDGPNPCHLNTFLNQVIRYGVSNFARGTQRSERPYDHRLDAADAAEAVGDTGKSPKDEDPAKLAADRALSINPALILNRGGVIINLPSRLLGTLGANWLYSVSSMRDCSRRSLLYSSGK